MALDKDLRGDRGAACHRDATMPASADSIPEDELAAAMDEYGASDLTQEALDHAWAEELQSRIADLEAGREATVSLEEVTARLHALLA